MRNLIKKTFLLFQWTEYEIQRLANIYCILATNSFGRVSYSYIAECFSGISMHHVVYIKFAKGIKSIYQNAFSKNWNIHACRMNIGKIPVHNATQTITYQIVTRSTWCYMNIWYWLERNFLRKIYIQTYSYTVCSSIQFIQNI